MKRWHDLPLRTKLTLLYLGLLSALICLLGAILYTDTKHFLISTTALRLRAQAKPVIERWFATGPGLPAPLAPPSPPSPGLPPAPPSESRQPSSGPVEQLTEDTAVSLSQALTSRDTTALVIDNQGHILATGRRLPEEPPAAPPDPQRINRALAGENEITYIDIANGQRTLVVLIPLRRTPTDPRILGVVQLNTPLATIDQILWRQRLLIGAGIIVAVLLGALGGLWITGSALAPLKRMIATCKRIAAGDLSQRVNLPRHYDEVGQLAAAFDDMVAHLEKAFAAQRRFVAAAAHELRTPLTAIKGSLEVLLRGSLDDKAAATKLIQGMYREVTRLNRLAEQLLSLTRLDTPVLIHKEKVNLAQFLNTVVQEAKLMAQERVITLNPGYPIVLEADPDSLKQVFYNLIDNAIRHTREGGKIEIGWGKKHASVEIWVADDGEGIPPTDLPHIFEPFYRGDRSRSRRRGGAGLGLSLAKGIVEAHGGTISVESSLGKGTCFRIRLPISDPERG